MQLRYYQQNAINAIFQYFADRQGINEPKNPLVAMPTGTGKSLTIGGFCLQVMSHYPRERFLMLTHVKELIEQNAKTLLKLWPAAPLGIFSAGLKRKDSIFPITFGGVASVVNALHLFQQVDFILIDEAHLLSPNDASMYATVIAHFTALNPALRVIGFTATPFRMGQGLLTDGGLFTDICYDLTGVAAFNQLIEQGYLSPLIPRATELMLDVSGVSIVQGDYNLGELDKKINKEKITLAACKEMLIHGHNRRAWLIFCAGISHAENTAKILNSLGIRAAAVHNNLKSSQRDTIINNFKTGRLTAITNFNILTTGFDYPAIDLIGMLRPTRSTPLWVQMLGRGTRPEMGKINCMVLDYPHNTATLGPINDPVIPKKKGEKVGEAPVKICEQCGIYNHASARFCVYCGAEFQFRINIEKESSTLPLIRTTDTAAKTAGHVPQTEWFPVQNVHFTKHITKSGKPALLATYHCGLRRFTEYHLFEHGGLPKHHAHDFWKQVHHLEPPDTVDQALTVIHELRKPKRIRVWLNNPNNKFPEILNYEF